MQLVNIQEVEQRNKQPVRRRYQSAIVVLQCDWLQTNTDNVWETNDRSCRISDLCVVSAGLDLDLDESSSVVTAGGSDDQRESSDSASFSIPSLDLSDGLTATGTSLDVEDGLSCSAVDTEAGSPSTEAPGLKDEETLGAAGEMCSDDLNSDVTGLFVHNISAHSRHVTTEVFFCCCNSPGQDGDTTTVQKVKNPVILIYGSSLNDHTSVKTVI